MAFYVEKNNENIRVLNKPKLLGVRKGRLIMSKRYKIGIVGCGDISDRYINNLKNMFHNTQVYILCNRTVSKAKAMAQKYDIPYVMTIEEMLSSEEVEVVVVLTLPDSHYEIAKQAILAGKHTYVEKPLALTVEEGKELVRLAKENHVLLGGTPDTFLGESTRIVRKFIEDGKLGNIVAANAFVSGKGHEHWHPSPAYFYKKGAGPMLDMGSYYVTTLIHLCGRVKQVAGFTSRAYEQRVIQSEPLKGQIIDVEVDTHVAGTIQFESGAIANVMTSFDICHTSLPFIEIYGTKGSLKLPCPSNFTGPILFCAFGEKEYTEIEVDDTYSMYRDNCRGIGLSQMLETLETGGDIEASGELASHVLEVMMAFEESGKQESYLKMN